MEPSVSRFFSAGSDVWVSGAASTFGGSSVAVTLGELELSQPVRKLTANNNAQVKKNDGQKLIDCMISIHNSVVN